LRADAPELLVVSRGEAVEDPFAAPGEADMNSASVGVRVFAKNELQCNKTVNQSDGAVMATLEPFGQLADVNAFTAGKSFDGEQGLVLLRRDSRPSGGFLAEAQELAQRVTECREVSIL
jgi:hypothetical protein